MTCLVRQMGHLTLAVPDPAASARDLCEIVGLRVTRSYGDTVFVSSNARAYEMAFVKAAQPSVLAIGLETDGPAEVDAIEVRVRSDGLSIIADRPLHVGVERAFRFRGPAGEIYEVHSPITRSQLPTGSAARPKRLEHVNLLVPDVRASGEFLARIFGMRLSDAAGENMLSWHRAADGFHHTIALGPGPGKLHHYAFDLRALEDLAAIADALAVRERALIWGPGRHGAGGNVFTYYVDRDGCIVENSIEMMRVDSEASYQPGHWQIGEGLSGRWINLWGGGPPADFGDPGIGFA